MTDAPDAPDDLDAVLWVLATVMAVPGPSASDAEFDAAVARARAIEDGPTRGAVAADLVRAAMAQAPGTPHHRLRHLDELLAMADRDPPAAPHWPRWCRFARAMAVTHGVSTGARTDIREALAEVDRLRVEAGDDPAADAMFTFARTPLTWLLAHQNGDETALQNHSAELLRMVSLGDQFPGVGSQMARLMPGLVAAAELLAAQRRGDDDEVACALDRLAEARADIPEGHHLGDVIDEAVERTSALLGRGADLASATSDRASTNASEEITDHLYAGGMDLEYGAATDPDRIEQGIAEHRAALALAPPGHPQRPFCQLSVAFGLIRRAEVSGTTRGLDEATALLEEAIGQLDGPHDPQWSAIHAALGWVRHRLGRTGSAIVAGLEGQRTFAWRVLLQSDVVGQRIAIADAARDAVDLARDCIGENDPAAALRALDSGRGLMLFAATALSGVGPRLRRAGHPELATRWDQARGSDGTGEPAGDLRRDVVNALAVSDDPLNRLLEPPSPDEIRTALSRVDADALVYLVPGEPPVAGWAVIAPAVGPPRFMALPELVVRDDLDVGRYLDALTRRSGPRDLVADDRPGEFADRLDALCDWAWRAAMHPLLDYLSRGTDGRRPRLVLVPMGDLGRVPWAAARDRDGRYAVESVSFSHAVSARMLCEGAARPPLALTTSGLIVADPDAGHDALVAARIEASAIRRAFYLGARYVGRRPDGTPSASGQGTAAEVREWLGSAAPGAGNMLHLACHGMYRAGSDGAASGLLLAGGELDARALLDTLTAAGHRDLALVVLAACNTGRSVHGYDEAYSLGTAFLAGRARSVLSTQWSIPDAPTSALMYMFHHHRRELGRSTGAALREAQLWMLDPRRKAPAGMPEELRPAPTGGHAEPAAWAGFLHWGQ